MYFELGLMPIEPAK